ncbi:MAG: hypothetical protein D6798_19140 [Deltaproteobacteria bacterium]|nr:MAG: hypothetical protein D6798_19140 [Deltaproteobacteria bacterium]
MFVGQGSLGFGDSVDAFATPPLAHGVPGFRLTNLSNSSDDFALELFQGGTTSVGTASSSDGIAELSVTADAGDWFCVKVSGSTGAYSLMGDLVAEAPAITDVRDSSGSSISSASIGDVVTILGSDLGSGADDVDVTFGGASAEIVSWSATGIDVAVPQNAVDGDLYVLRSDARSNAWPFTVGVSSPAAAYTTAPDPAWLNDGFGPGVYLNRTLVSFDPGADASAVSAALDAVLALDSNRSTWTEVGFMPRSNSYLIEWSWVAGYSVGWADTDALFDDLAAQAAVAGLDAEYPVQLASIELPLDHDLLHDAGPNKGAFAQVGLEEARRLFRYSALGGMSSTPRVVLVDTGLRYGDDTWNADIECVTGTPAFSGGVDEFPADYFALMERDGTGWSATAAPGHYAIASGKPTQHGNSTASVIGARSQGQPDWADGTARTGNNTNGVLAAFELQGVDDEGSTPETVDEVGESIDYSVVVFNVFSEAGSFTETASEIPLFMAMDEIASNPAYDGAVVVLPVSFPAAPPFGLQFKHGREIEDLCRDHIVVASAGTGTSGTIGVGAALSCLGGSTPNAIASDLACYCPERSIVVGGTEAGGNGAGTDTWAEAFDGAAVDLLAPFGGYTVATVCVDMYPYPSRGYHVGVAGTSYGVSLVGAAASLVRGIVDDVTLSDEGVVQLIESSVDDVSSLYTGTGATGRFDLYEAVERALDLAGGLPAHMLGTVRVYAVDYGDDVLVAQDIVDLDAGTFAPYEAGVNPSTATVTDDGCYGPTDVEVHPRGDVVYVLCSDSSEVAAYTADDLSYIGSVSLDGVTEHYSELEITPDGILRVATVDGSGALLLESFDSYSGSKHINAETLYDTDIQTAYGIHSSHDGVEVAVVATDGETTGEDAGTQLDVVAVVDPDPIGKTDSVVTIDDVAGASGTFQARDVTWRAPDGSVVVALYGDLGPSAGTDYELYETDWTSLANEAEVTSCEDPVSVSVNPTGDDDIAYLSCQQDHSVAVIDLASVSSSYTPAHHLYADLSTPSDDFLPTVVDFADNGRFVMMGFQNSTSGSSWVTTADHDAVPASSTSDLLRGDVMDTMSHIFYKPRGMDMTPLMSVMSPRPGTVISGVRTVQVVVRDPSVLSVAFIRGPTTLCVDHDVLDGIAECEIDLSTWTSGEHVIEIEATTDSANQYRIHAAYTTP